MKKNRYTKSLLRRIEPLVRAGILEKPTWYRAVKETPPYHRRPSDGLKELKLPWDRLASAFVERNPFMVEDPEWLGPNGMKPGEPPLRHKFAKRQYALMQKGIPQEEAYQRVEAAMKQERRADVEVMRRMVHEASFSSGARPSFVSDEGVYDGLRQWQAMMAETKYAEWDTPAKHGLDTFLRREVMRWDDSRFEAAKASRDGTAEAIVAETARLRIALFPDTKSDKYECPSDVVATPPAQDEENQEPRDSGVDGEAGTREQPVVGDEDWTSNMEEFAEAAVEYPFESDWDPETRRRLDSFVMRRCVRRAVLEETFGWIPAPEPPKADTPPAEESTRGNGGQAEDHPVDRVGSGLGADPSGQRKTPDFLLDKDGALDLDFNKQASVGFGGGLFDGGTGDAEEEEEGEEDDDDERWIVTGGGEQGDRDFDVDWMAAAKHRVGGRKRREEVLRPGSRKFPKEVAGSTEEALRKNLEVVLNQAKRQLLPGLKLEVDEHGLTPEEWVDRLRATKKTVMVDVKQEKDDNDRYRQDLLAKLKAEFGEPQGMPWHYREQRMQEGVSRAEKRRLRKKEKLAFKEYQYKLHEDMFGHKSKEQMQKEAAEQKVEDLEKLYPRLGEEYEMENAPIDKRSYPAKRGKSPLWRTPPMPVQQKHRKKD